jgi:holo-[acyl-carrier protein] synthase
MILGIGVDTVDIKRFALWHTYTHKTLRRIFSQEEIEYCLLDVNKSAERFAVRFAVREALYKALSYAFSDKKIPFLTLCSHAIITKIDGRPYLIMRKDFVFDLSDLMLHLSLSHSSTVATAFIIIESKLKSY